MDTKNVHRSPAPAPAPVQAAASPTAALAAASATAAAPAPEVNPPAVAVTPVTPADTAAASEPYSDLEDVLATSKSRSTGGSKIRDHVGYTLVADKIKELANTSVPEQEKVILKLVRKALIGPMARVVAGHRVVTERDLNKIILAAFESKVLKTRQDAWHIFRYYRADLKKRGIMLEIELPIAS